MKTIVRLKILSDVMSAEDMASSIGITPDRMWNIGDFRPHTIIRENNNGIIICSGKTDRCSQEQHLKALMRKIMPLRRRILLYSQHLTLELSCVIYSDYQPPVNFPSHLISFLASIGAGLDVDIYITKNDD